MSASRLTLKKSVLAVAATLAPCLLLPTIAFGQTAPAPAKMEKVEITGSSIKRIDAETALPVTVLKREDIERTGAVSTEELVKQLTALSSGGSLTSAAGASGFTGGNIATVSLRGLGGGRTLILINGRRSSVYGGGSAGAAGSSVDINAIPLSAIDRVEVLKDGASAIYGSDAIAGVVNFILRKDFTGVEGTVSYGQPVRSSHGADKRASVFAGFGTLAEQGYNVNFNASVQATGPIFGIERPYANRLNVAETNDITSSISFPANVLLYNQPGGRLVNPTYPNCGPISTVSPYFANQCRFDNSSYVSIQPQSDRGSLMLNGRLALNSTTEAYFESNYNQVKTTTTTQPVLFSGTALPAGNPYNAIFRNLVATQYPNAVRFNFPAGTFLLPPTSPYYPTAFAAANGIAGLPLSLQYRDAVSGPRKTRDIAEATRIVTGVKGSVAGWDYDTGLLYSESRVNEVELAGYTQYSKGLPILNSGLINPFGPTADQNAVAALRAAGFTGTAFTSRTSLLSLDGRAQRELYTLPAGTVNVSVGGELRKETFAYNPSVAIQTGDISGIGGNAFPVSASRNVGSAYVEVNVPLLKTLETDFAVRYDHYEKVGQTINPKASVRWQPTKTILLRSAVGTGFRAPSLTDLYTSQATNVASNGTRDPIRCPDVKTGSPSDCNFQFPTVTGGNPDLKPEKSISYTIGVVFEPTRDISLSLDAFRVNLKDSIVAGGLNYTYFLATAARASQYASFITRGAPDGNASGVGPIVSIRQTNANLFKSQLAGVDVDAKYLLRLPDAQKATFRLSGTYMGKYDVQGPDGSYNTILDQAISASGGGVVLRWKHVASATYETGPWNASLAQNYQKSYTDTAANRAPAGTPIRNVASYQTFDGQVVYSGFKSTKLTFGIKNLFDRNPPYTNNASNFLGGYDVSYADVRGRFGYITATYSFK